MLLADQVRSPLIGAEQAGVEHSRSGRAERYTDGRASGDDLVDRAQAGREQAARERRVEGAIRAAEEAAIGDAGRSEASWVEPEGDGELAGVVIAAKALRAGQMQDALENLC